MSKAKRKSRHRYGIIGPRVHFFGWLGAAFKSEVAIVADIVGSLGFVILIMGVFQWLNKTDLLGFPVLLWAWTLGLMPFIALAGWAIISWVHYINKRSLDTELAFRRQRREYENEIDEIQKEVFRAAQKRAFNAACGVYGYYVKSRSHHYTIYKDGRATCVDRTIFVSKRRALSAWSRTMSSTRAESLKPGIMLEQDNRFTVKVEHQLSESGNLHALTEKFLFNPTIRPDHRAVAISWKDELPASTFCFHIADRRGSETFDFIQTSPHEPVRELDLRIEFHDVEPGNVSAEAIYGPSKEILLRETIEAEEVLGENDRDDKFIVNLKILYPLMGVNYRIKWDLHHPRGEMELARNSPAQAIVQVPSSVAPAPQTEKKPPGKH
jgi:hypothetical protein